MSSLVLFPFSLVTGCFYTCEDCVTRADVDAMLADGDYYTRDEVDAIAAQAVSDALAEADTRYQEKGEYLTADNVDEYCVTDAELDAKGYATLSDLSAYQPVGDYLTQAEADGYYQPLGSYLTKTDADLYFQPLGSYLSKTEADGYYQPLGSYLTKAEADGYYAPAGDYALSTDLDGFATEAWVDANYYDMVAADGRFALLSDVTALDGEYVKLMTTDTAYPVGSEAELLAALADLDHYRIASGVVATIQIADGSYSFSEPIAIQHPDGARVRIVGNETDPTAVDLTFAEDGVGVARGGELGYLGGLTLTGSGSSSPGTGLLVTDHSWVAVGPLVVSGFSTGIEADMNSVIDVDSGVSYDSSTGWLLLTDNGIGARADAGSVVFLRYAVAENNTIWGVYASGQSMLDAYGLTAEDNANGIGVAYGSSVAAEHSMIAYNDGVGATVVAGAQANLDGALVTGNGDDNIFVTTGGVVSVEGGTVSASLAGAGASVSYGSVLDADGTTFQGNDREGVIVTYSSTASGENAIVNDNADDGAQIEAVSSANLQGATLNRDPGVGLIVAYESYANFLYGSTTGNAHGIEVVGDSLVYSYGASHGETEPYYVVGSAASDYSTDAGEPNVGSYVGKAASESSWILK